MNIREKLQKDHPEVELLFLTDEAYDEAIIGVGKHIDNSTGKEVKAVFYSREKVIEINLSLDLGLDWFGYNQEGAYVGEQTPVYV